MITRPAAGRLLPFLLFWLLAFVLYFPARHAGFVSDTTGWLHDIQTSSFTDHINRVHFKVQSLYQFTQLITWLLYQLFGTNTWLWHLAHVSLHALNCVLLYRLTIAVLDQDQVVRSRLIAATGATLFCVLPSAAEVVVWEASFHYLLGLLLLLTILQQVRRYLFHPRPLQLGLILLLYALSTYSIELFYVTPFMCGALLWFYGPAAALSLKQSMMRLVVPMCALLLLHFVQVQLAYGHWLPHISTNVVTHTEGRLLAAKPLKYLFHLLFLGRFFAQDLRDQVYAFCERPLVIATAFSGLLGLLAWSIYQRRQPGAKSFLLFLAWSALTMGLIVPLWFQQSFWVVYDRYAYFFAAFFFMWLSLSVYRLLGRRTGFVLLLGLGLVNTYACLKVSRKWGLSAGMVDALMKGLPPASDKPVLLLNMPHCLNGIFMICGGSEQEALEQHNASYTPALNYELIDVCANNILSVNDGAHVQVLNDSMLRVTLNQWGTWWWYDGMGAVSYEHPYYRVNMIDNGHFYELTLKGDPARYRLLFQNGLKWRPVDFSRKDVEQY